MPSFANTAFLRSGDIVRNTEYEGIQVRQIAPNLGSRSFSIDVRPKETVDTSPKTTTCISKSFLYVNTKKNSSYPKLFSNTIYDNFHTTEITYPFYYSEGDDYTYNWQYDAEKGFTYKQTIIKVDRGYNRDFNEWDYNKTVKTVEVSEPAEFWS